MENTWKTREFLFSENVHNFEVFDIMVSYSDKTIL